MAKILIITVALVIFLSEYSHCRSVTKRTGVSKRQYALAPNSAALRYGVPFRMEKSPMRRSYPLKIYSSSAFSLPTANLHMPSNQTQIDWKNETFKNEALSNSRKQSYIKPNAHKKTAQHDDNAELLKASNTRLDKHQKEDLLKRVIKKPLKDLETQPNTPDDVAASKRAAPAVAGLLAKLAGSGKIQEAVVEKGIEVAGKLVDKQLQIIDEAQQKASDFLKKEIKLDITPDKGWESEDMLVPPGYHINAEIEGSKASNHESAHEQPYTYPAGIGSVMMNGCWGTNYKPGDPCFNGMAVTEQCQDMIDGAAFIGVGFDGRGEYSPESRKMSIIQRSCAGKSSYDNLQVPDTMNVHGIYDTTASMTVFTSRSEYQKYLQKEAGVSGSYFGFYAGVKKAWGSSENGAAQTNLAVFDIDVDRYEIFQDEVKPQDLSRNFLREFISLPDSYFAPGAPAKFQDFILRWGTHYIKSARFGGQLELRKTQLASMTASKEEFAMECEVEFKSLFMSAGARKSEKSGSSSKSQKKYMSTSLAVQGGSQRIAAIVSDMYSPTFKNEFTAWLESIPAYPKAFKFLMGSIPDLLNFRANDLFPDENIKWGCELRKMALQRDEKSGKSYYMEGGKRVYCEFTDREEMEFSLSRKRVSLKRAIEVYTEEGTMSISDISLPAGDAGCQSKNPEHQSEITKPSWKEMTNGHKRFRVMFDMVEDLKGAIHGGIDIPKSMSRIVRFSQGKWYATNKDGEFHLYDGFNNGESGNVANKKISIFGLVLKYDETDGSLTLNSADYKASAGYFPELSELLKERQLARVEWPHDSAFTNSTPKSVGHSPCNVQWSNGLRFDPSDRDGKCLHFIASTKGALYVVFSAVPSNKDSWYHVKVTPLGVGIYKSQRLQVSTVNINAVAIGDALLYQSYFVCVTESPTSTVIEYGKSQGTTDSGDVYLTMIDNDQPLHVRFYSFGNGEEPAQIVDSHVISRKLTTTECKGDTYRDEEEPNCVQRCHEACAPLAGCKSRSQGDPKASECNECRYAKDRKDVCLTKCPGKQKPNKKKYCQESFDLQFKTEVEPADSDVTGFPTMNELTICLWLGYPTNPKNIKYKILDYVNKESSHPLFEITASVEGDGKMTITFTVGPKGKDPESGRFLTFKKDDKWHLYCATRESNTGITNVFIDGRKPYSFGFTIHPGRTPMAGGKMHVGGFGEKNYSGKISSLNIWNKILTNSEIEKIAQSCGDIAGNVKDWYDIKTDLVLSKYTVETPSQCRADI